MPLVSEQAQEHVGPSLHFPATVPLECCKASVAPCTQVATTKIRKPADVLAGYVKRPCVVPQNPACVPADIHMPPPEGRQLQGADPQQGLGSNASTLVALLLSFSPALSTQLLNPQCWLCPFVVGSGPGLQRLLCKHKGRARSVCGILILTAVVFTFGGMLHAQERQQISSGPEKTSLPLPPCAFLTSYAQPAASPAGEGLNTHVLWEQG